MSKPTLVRYVNTTTSAESPVEIDCTGGNYVVVKQMRGGSSSLAWETVSYDSTELPVIASHSSTNAHVKISGFPAPVQDEIQLDIVQDEASNHRVVVEVWSGVDLAAPFRDARTSQVGSVSSVSLTFPEVLEHEVIGLGMQAHGTNGTSFSTPGNGTLIVRLDPNTNRGVASYYSNADGEDVSVSVGNLNTGSDQVNRLSGFLLVGQEPGAPEIVGTTYLKAGQPLTITVTDASASGNTVILSPTTDHEHADAEEQTIDSEGETEIVTEGIVLPDGAGPTDGLYLFVIDDDDNVSDPFEVTVSNPAIAFSGIRNSAGTLHTGTVDIKVWTDDPTQNDAAELLDSDALMLTGGEGLHVSDDIGAVEDPVWVVLRYVAEGRLNTLVAAATVTDHQPE